YLVHLYEEDPSFPAGLNGRFHGLLVDRRRGTSTLFNDRYGMHRIYYHEAKEAFYFAAEAKAILGVRPELRRADPRGLGELMAWQKAPPGSLPCYTFGGMFRDSQDVLVARQVARVCEQSHEVIAVGEDFLVRFPSYAERTVYLTDGCVAVNHAPDLYLNEMVRTIAPIRITGNYGGEVLRRVRAFKPVAPLSALFRPEFLPHVPQAEETY